MIERLIYTALSDGLAEALAQPQRLDLLLRTLCQLSETEAAAARQYLIDHPPRVFHSYPMKDQTEYPSFHIVLGEEVEDQQFLDDLGGFLNEDETSDENLLRGQAGSEIITSIYRFQYHILVASENPDTTLYLYQFARYFLTLKRHFFKENGILIQSLSGADLAPDPNYQPSFIFIRRLSFTCKAEQPIYGDLLRGEIRRVDGIYVDDGNVSDVLTNVTSYETEIE